MKMPSSCGRLFRILIILSINIFIFHGCNNINQIGSPDPTNSDAIPSATAEPEVTVNKNVLIEKINFGGMTKRQASQTLDDYSKQVNVEKKDAAYNEKDWETIYEESTGKKLNMELTLKRLFLAKEGETIQPVVEKTYPSVTVSDLKSRISEIAYYKTKIIDATDNRINNLILSCQYIDGYIVNPGSIFSFNEIIGDTTKEKGYQDGHVYLKDKNGVVQIVDAPGGGICQVSSTIFNAADQCGLTIIERHEHSKDVSYVPPGRDATISIGSLDLKIQNNRSNKIMIKVKVDKKYVIARILERVE